MVKTTVFFICDQLLRALIHLNFIIMILMFLINDAWCKLLIYGCSSARTTLAVSLYWNLTLEKNIVAVISQNKVTGDNLKRKIKNQT